MNRQIRQVAFLVLVMFTTLALSVTSVQGLARPSVWESWSANGALNSDPRNRRTVSRNFDTERGPILLAGGTTIASTQKSDDGQGSEDYQRVYANGPLYAPVTGYFSPAFASMTGMEKEGNSVLNGDDPSLFSSRIKTLITGDSQRGGAVELTIKPEIQQAAYDALAGREGAVVALDPKTGAILALVSTPSYDPSAFATRNGNAANEANATLSQDSSRPLDNRAIAGNRYPPGSTFKAIILAEWLKTGHTPYQMLNASAPKNYGPNTFTVSCDPDRAAGSWPVNNVAGTNAGMMTVREATKQSINTGFTEMLRDLDVCEVTKLAASMGITKADGSQLDPDPSIALGSTPVPPLSMANAYATFASGGKYCKPIAIDQILDASGTSMAVPSADCTQAMDQGAADETAKTLRATSEPGGTAKDAVFGRPIGGKTGTTDDNNDAWFVGFTPQLATAVWIGHAGSPRTLNYQQIGPHYIGIMYGSDLAVPMWRDYMSQAVGNDPVLPIPSHG